MLACTKLTILVAVTLYIDEYCLYKGGIHCTDPGMHPNGQFSRDYLRSSFDYIV